MSIHALAYLLAWTLPGSTLQVDISSSLHVFSGKQKQLKEFDIQLLIDINAFSPWLVHLSVCSAILQLALIPLKLSLNNMHQTAVRDLIFFA